MSGHRFVGEARGKGLSHGRLSPRASIRFGAFTIMKSMSAIESLGRSRNLGSCTSQDTGWSEA